MYYDIVPLVRSILERADAIGLYATEAAGELLSAYARHSILRMERRCLEPREEYIADPAQAMIDSEDRIIGPLEACHLAWSQFDSRSPEYGSACRELADALRNATQALKGESRVWDPSSNCCVSS